MFYLLLVPVVLAGSLDISRELIDKVRSAYGGSAADRVLDWKELIHRYQNSAEGEKLEAVNGFFNKLSFVDDDAHWGIRDYWASPVEFLGTNGGDCEDFSIAKYFTLRELGVPDKRLRITYVKAIELDQAHMVLSYYKTPKSEPLILDNLVDEIRSASDRDDLVPVYGFNGGGLWLSVERGRGRKVGGSGRIRLWRDLNARMAKQFGKSVQQ
ncbi:MAG: sulfate adenylyltransferase [Gammaproteobacteria bacterium]|nr:sulfate adenylyltransferase [Gammaproteobacteria bacterium]